MRVQPIPVSPLQLKHLKYAWERAMGWGPKDAGADGVGSGPLGGGGGQGLEPKQMGVRHPSAPYFALRPSAPTWPWLSHPCRPDCPLVLHP